MEKSSLNSLERRMYTAYEKGRMRRAAIAALPVILFSICALVLGIHSTRHAASAVTLLIILAIGLSLSAWILIWRGQALGQIALPATTIGLIPFLCAYCSKWMDHICTENACYSVCAPLCGGGGFIAGAIITRFAFKTKSPGKAWASGTALVLLTGSLGCACMGYTGMVSLVAGTCAGSLAGYLFRTFLIRKV